MISVERRIALGAVLGRRGVEPEGRGAGAEAWAALQYFHCAWSQLRRLTANRLTANRLTGAIAAIVAPRCRTGLY